MRRLLGGALVALLTVVGACGTPGPDQSDRAADSDASIAGSEAELASAERVITTTPASPATLRVLVTSPEGVDSAGLDAAASVLLARPDFATAVVAPAADVTGAGDDRSTSGLASIDGHTMTGLPARVVNGTAIDALETALVADGLAADLVVIGFTAGETIGPAPADSAAFATARAANAHGIPALVVEVGGDEPDLAAAGLLLNAVVDFELESVLAGTTTSLTVPSCQGGTVRGPVVVDASTTASVPPTPDCTGSDPGDMDDDLAALAAGFAALVAR